MKRFTTLLKPMSLRSGDTQIVSTALYEYLRAEHLDHSNNSSDATDKLKLNKVELLHKAIREDDYELATTFLSLEGIQSKDEYGDTPIIMALSDRNHNFLDAAKKLSPSKNKEETSRALSIIADIENPNEQEEMLGYVKYFYNTDIE